MTTQSQADALADECKQFARAIQKRGLPPGGEVQMWRDLHKTIDRLRDLAASAMNYVEATSKEPPTNLQPKPERCPDFKGYVSGGGLDHVMAKARAMPGWKLVPVAPTDAMLKAVRWDVDAFGGRSAWPSDIYRAMLEAAPPAPAAETLSSEGWAELYHLRAAVKGPKGFETWQDAAVHERMRRVKAEKREPLTDGQIENVAIEGGWQSHELPAFEAGVRFAEEHHGITPKEPK